jgi:hypothetical protein
MCTAISHLAGVGDINGLSLAGREQFLRTRVDGMLPLVRCVYKVSPLAVDTRTAPR